MVAEAIDARGDTEVHFRSGLRYRSLGKFFEAALNRRDLSLEEVSHKTGLSEDVLRQLIQDERKFDSGVVKKLRPLFPTTYRSFSKWQDDIDKMNSAKISSMSKIGSPRRKFG
ncbi:helix-turn-helix domain-containing protein [Sphingobium sp. HWE2-09]|uniref:helix-turn-helix domain-containing protein n=1 Tax=Sphingobium sp. HWE2-09 TaxID=3108390 RepID=UPI002DC98926|nr:helix-turn-helix transcriptional regulator [Sphingobium sp. HWE2-09]